MLVKGSKSVPFTSQQSRSAYKSAVLLKFVPNVAKLLMQLIIYSTLNEDHGFDSCYSYFSRKRSWTFSVHASWLLSKKILPVPGTWRRTRDVLKAERLLTAKL